MNERLQKLAEQAGLEYNFDPMLWLKQEKFVELIIRECALQCLHNEDMDLIEKHFGVEE